MRIGIDARMCGPEQGGIGRYIYEIIKTLKHENNHADLKFVIFLRKENWDLVEETPNIKKVPANIPWYGWREQLFLSKIIKKEKVDLMHFPHWNIPIFYNRPFIVTIHDLLLLHYPTRRASALGPISYFFKNLAYRFVLRHAIKKSKKIITPSEFTKNDILKYFNVPAEKITAIHLGVSDFKTDLSVSTGITKKYNITKPYILYVGVAYPHKNLDGLIQAWNIFEEKYSHDYQLVLAGKKNYFYAQLMNNERLKNKNILFPGFIPDENLPELYENASLYVFPSFYEGFGLPPLEAIKYGVPVASSDRSCLPEILQNSAVYFNPEKHEEIAKIMNYLLTDLDTRKNLISNGKQLLQKYSWANTGQRTLDIYLDGV